jgi:hypothetical protein
MAISATEAHYIIEFSLHDFPIDGRSRNESLHLSSKRPSLLVVSAEQWLLSNPSTQIHHSVINWQVINLVHVLYQFSPYVFLCALFI